MQRHYYHVQIIHFNRLPMNSVIRMSPILAEHLKGGAVVAQAIGGKTLTYKQDQ